MPRYVYECECGHQEEQQRRIDDRMIEDVCPKCGKKLLFAPHLVTPAPFFPGADRWH